MPIQDYFSKSMAYITSFYKAAIHTHCAYIGKSVTGKI